MDFTVYAAINLLIDLVLLIALGQYVPRHAPKLFICLAVLCIGQYLVRIPVDELPGLQTDAPQPRHQVAQAVERIRAARAGLEDSGATALPAPRFGLPGFGQLFGGQSPIEAADAALDQAEAALQSLDSAPRTWWGRWVAALWTDPYALWLLVRIFWLAAALILFVQRPTLGAEVCAFQLIPLPFLTFALPYTYHWLHGFPWFIALQSTLRDPVNAWNYLTPERLGVTVVVFAALLLILICTTVVLLARRTSPLALVRRRYLDPSRYNVRINGTLYEFTVDGEHLEVQGVRLDCRRFAVFEGREHMWRLPSSTVLEFVDRAS